MWGYKRWAVQALVALGRKAEAIRYAEATRGPWTNDGAVDAVCEEILLSSGLPEEAYARYAVRAPGGGTYLASFRRLAARYPHKRPEDVLADLVATMPESEGKWFAAAKDVGLYDEALALAERSPCDPKTLTRAARDFVKTRPAFSVEAGLLALRWLAEGYGYEVTGADVQAAYSSTIAAAERLGSVPQTRHRIRQLLLDKGKDTGLVHGVLERELGLA
jgi:hypothetical protein